MRMMIGGREVEVPTNSNGQVDVVEARRRANIPDNRAIIQQRSSGENYILPKRGTVNVSPYDHFMESPRAVRGKQ